MRDAEWRGDEKLTEDSRRKEKIKRDDRKEGTYRKMKEETGTKGTEEWGREDMCRKGKGEDTTSIHSIHLVIFTMQ
jgi:hypothetical protein